jgi:hypothetical protein
MFSKNLPPYGDIIIAGKTVQFRLSLSTSEQRGIFIILHMLRHGTSGFVVFEMSY